MTSLPICPACRSVYTYELEAMFVYPECAHEWPQQAAADEPAEAAGVVGILARFGCRVGLALSCAVAIAPLGAQQLPLVEVRFLAFDKAIRTDTIIHGWERLEGSRVETFAALQSVFATLGVELDFLDPSRTALGALRLRPPRRLDGKRLSTYFNCGRTMIGENADTQRVTIAIVTYLRDVSPTVTEVGTALTGMAQDLSGAAGEASACASIGVLEERIASMARERLTAPARR